MKKVFISVVQKCICVDFLLNSLINSNSYSYLNFLSDMKDENLRNIKIMCHLYELSHIDTLIVEDVNPIELCKPYNNHIGKLLEFYLKILNELEYLKKFSINPLELQLLHGLISTYFNYISTIHCFYSIDPNINLPTKSFSKINLNNDLSLHKDNIPFFSLYGEEFNNSDNKSTSIDLIRGTALQAINTFFDYYLVDEIICEEHYEVFFEGVPENKFYQLFLRSLDYIFKVRIWDKNAIVFYMYKNTEKHTQTIPTMSKESAKTLSDSFLAEKLGINFENLSFNEDSLNIYSHMNIPDIYKFKYNLKDINGKPISNKGIYLTINTKCSNIQEIYLS